MGATEQFEETGWRPHAHLLNGLEVAAVAIDPAGRVTYCNSAAVTRLGRNADALVGENGLELLFPPASAATVEEIHRRVLAGASWTGELPVLGLDGAGRVTGASWSPVHADGKPTGALILLEESAGDAGQARRVAKRLQRLAQVTTELLTATDVDAVTEVVVVHMAEAAGATVSSLSVLVDTDTLALMGIAGGREGAASRWATYPVSANTPAGEAVRTGHTIVITGANEFRARYPDLEMATEGERSLICLPLEVAGRSIGVVSLSFPKRSFDPAELEFFEHPRRHLRAGLEPASGRRRSGRREAKLEFLADASVELARSLDYADTLEGGRASGRPAVRRLVRHPAAPDGVLRPLAVAHTDAVQGPGVKELAGASTHRDPHARGAPSTSFVPGSAS